MSKFTEPLVITPIPGGKKWRLVESFSYYIGKQDYLIDYGIIIEVPTGFVTDGASIPRFAWSIVGSPMTGKYIKAAILHDFTYHIGMFSRKICDKIFLHSMQVLKVPFWKRQIIYFAVRLFGDAAYKHQ